MAVKLAKGVDLLAEIEGQGIEAEKGSRVRYAARMFLSRGDEVTRDAQLIENDTGYLQTKEIDGVRLILHPVEIGRRRTIAGIEKALVGMKPGGFREVSISPHLAYGEQGIPGYIPQNALLRVKIWLEDVQNAT